MKEVLFRSWEDLQVVREKMKDKKDTEDIAVIFDDYSVQKLNVQAIADELNFIRVANNYDISQYGFTEPGSDTFGYLYVKKEE